MIKASIDIGSNSTLLLIAEVDDDNIKEILCDFAEVTSLGKDLDKNKVFIQESMDKTLTTLKLYKEECEKFGLRASDIIATATEASRVALNSNEFYELVLNTTGIHVEIISGEEEAYFSTRGVMTGTTESSFTLMDMGGASCELIKVENKKIVDSISLPLGSVRSMDWMNEGNFEDNLARIFKDSPIERYKTDSILCIAGTMTSIACVYLNQEQFKANEVDGLSLDINSYTKLIPILEPEAISNKYKFLNKRAPMLKPGATAGLKIFKRLGISNIVFSTRGLRFGVLVESLKSLRNN